MAIISQETFDKFTEKEKQQIRHMYQDFTNKTEAGQSIICGYEDLFGIENLCPKPQIKTWEDCQKMNEDSNFFLRIEDNLELPDKIYSKCIATLKIVKLIELGYGGMVSEEEWIDESIMKWCVICDYCDYITLANYMTDRYYHFIAFHTPEQREEFMSYPENVELVKQYYIIQ